MQKKRKLNVKLRLRKVIPSFTTKSVARVKKKLVKETLMLAHLIPRVPSGALTSFTFSLCFDRLRRKAGAARRL